MLYLSIGAGSSNMTTVPWVESSEAPTVEGDIEAGRSNSRRIDPQLLQSALTAAGLEAMVNPGGIFAGPPVVPLHQEHLDAVSHALDEWVTAHGTAQPRFNQQYAGDYKGVEGATEADSIMGLLTWLKFWMTWALQNARVPAVMAR